MLMKKLFAGNWLAWLMLGIGLLLTAFSTYQVKSRLEREQAVAFGFVCDQVSARIEERLAAHALVLRGGSGLFDASGSVERNEWSAYINAVRPAGVVPGVVSIGFAAAVAADQLAAHSARMRQGRAGYGVQPPGERAFYAPMIYLEPERSPKLVGYDNFADPVRRAAMERARDSGAAALSGRVELLHRVAGETQFGVVMYVPVYRQGAAIGTPEERRAALAGWVFGVFRTSELMTGILAGALSDRDHSADLHVYAGATTNQAQLLFDSHPGHPFAGPGSPGYQTRTLEFNGSRWLLEFDPSGQAWQTGLAGVWPALLDGVALSGLLFVLMLAVLNTRREAERIAAKLTAELRAHSIQLGAIFDLSPDGFVTFDAAHCVRYVSPTFVAMTGMNAAEMAGLDETVFSARLAAACLPQARFIGVAPLRASAADVELDGSRPVGSGGERRRQKIELAGPPKRVLEVDLRLSADEAISQILYFRDVTHETEVDRMKSEFLSTAAHELRTPMSSIFGFTELLMTRDLDEADKRDFLRTIFGQSERMIAIINELLDLSRIESRRGKDFVITAIDLGELLRKVVADFKTPDGRPAPQLPSAADPLTVKGDRRKLTQVLSNVFSNAYKYSPGGGAVSVELLPPQIDPRAEPGSAARRVGIRIRDRGIGMTPPQVARACERFYRADSSGRIPGTGLGMSIVKEIMELHGGQVEIASEAGTGTTVTLWLPAAKTE